MMKKKKGRRCWKKNVGRGCVQIIIKEEKNVKISSTRKRRKINNIWRRKRNKDEDGEKRGKNVEVFRQVVSFFLSLTCSFLTVFSLTVSTGGTGDLKLGCA